MSNHLKNQSSPYLLQHAENPVNWYPWCEEAFAQAKAEDKPIFLSIGYSTCHWCHVMARESFEDEETARILNEKFISIKVDKEERPDIDAIYMSVCQVFTGSGGWPTSIFMTPDQKPFFAGTYFPKNRRFGMISFPELLEKIADQWKNNRDMLLQSAQGVVESLQNENQINTGMIESRIIERAVKLYRQSYDSTYGGFGSAPKFPSPHNLIFLLNYYEKNGPKDILKMVEHTLIQMYRGGIFDHIGYGFSRYSTDQYFLVPHFEKMLYDNALLIYTYCRMFEVTDNSLYREIAKKSATYVIREMTSKEGGFFSAQDADSEGEEGKYYVFSPEEIIKVLGETNGKKFNDYYDITESGNFEGKNIPNLLKSENINGNMDVFHSDVYKYRKQRYSLHQDDKILTAWNGLMISAMCELYRITREEAYLKSAEMAQKFISEYLCDGQILYVSYREGVRGPIGFLEDYANYIYALFALYEVTFNEEYMDKAVVFCKKTIDTFWDKTNHGFYLSGIENEKLIIRPKETYDGAIPSGNSVMAYNLVRLSFYSNENFYERLVTEHLEFCSTQASDYPPGYAMFLNALCDYLDPPEKITVVIKGKLKDQLNELKELPFQIRHGSVVKILEQGKEGYKLINDKTTYYVCKNHNCLPPTNQLP